MMITVYFVGLFVFLNADSKGVFVAAPQTRSGVVRGRVPLDLHTASVVIQGMTAGATDCPRLGGKWDNDKMICTVADLQGKVITLSGATPRAFAMDKSFGSIPKLKAANLCPGATGVRMGSASSYAVSMTIDNGKLAACAHGKPWVSNLTTADHTLAIGKGLRTDPSAALQDGAVVTINHEPVAMSSSVPLAHFGWYYEMLIVAGTCDGIPGEATGTHCLIPGATTDVGCSNSSYP